MAFVNIAWLRFVWIISLACGFIPASGILSKVEGEELMKHIPSHLILLLALMLGGNLAYGQGSLGAKPKKPRTLDDYESRTLKDVTTKASDAESLGNKEETMMVEADILPSRVRVTHTGSARPLPQIKKEVLLQWARRYAGSIEHYTAPYETEMLFVENGTEYWLAVKKESLPHFEQELKKGEAVDLYLIRVGAVRAADKWEWMLLVENFQKPKR